MERITDRLIHRKIERMQAAGMDVALDGQYGRFAVVTKDESRKLSPRLPNRQIYDWLDAYEQGYEAGKRAGVVEFQKSEHEAKSYDLDRD